MFRTVAATPLIVLHVGSDQVDKVLPTVDDSPLG